ncbi:hypothetical protein GCM10008983_16050 [Lentibacillus halophilus]|uniref:DUF2007 domain-containing protein n=1 Tax=Lentibacillus halophilus TaxID=295065 RepID=A0ABN0Z997_9BACI
MFEIILITSVLTLIILFSDTNRYETVYSGTESSLSEANDYYWLLKNYNIPVRLQIPYNWENFYRFGYKESPVYIKVSQKKLEKARHVMMHYRVEKSKMERNIKAEKNK